jgi:PatG Domain
MRGCRPPGDVRLATETHMISDEAMHDSDVQPVNSAPTGAGVSTPPVVAPPPARSATLPPRRGWMPAPGLVSQTCSCGADGSVCSCGGGGPTGFVYAIGSVEARFPSQSIEKEFIQVWSPTRYNGPVSQHVIYQVLSQGQNLYLAREMCWVFSNEGIDLYLVQPRSYVELTDLILALGTTPGDTDYDLLIGQLGPIAPAQLCNGLQLPLVLATQVFTFSQNAFLNNIVAYAASIGLTVTLEAAKNAFDILIQLTDNAGQTDEQRAINYVTFKSVDVYVLETQQEQATPPYQLTNVTARPSSLGGGTRAIVDVIFVYTNTVTPEVHEFFTRVDVTGQFPFLVTGIAPFYDHP